VNAPLACRTAELSLGALVLGALDPNERSAVEEHLSTCERCSASLQELATLPAVMSRITLDDIDAALGTGTPDLLPRLVDAAEASAVNDDAVEADAVRKRAPEPTPLPLSLRTRRRRLVAALGSAAAVAAVAAMAFGFGVVGPRSHNSVTPTGSVVTASATDPATHVSATVELAPVATGTRLGLSLSGVEPGEHCQLVAVSTDGRQEVAATWEATYAGTAHVSGNTALSKAEIARLEVTTFDGRMLVSLPAPS